MRRRKICCAIDAVGGRPRDRAARAVAGIRTFNGNDGDRNLALAPSQQRIAGSNQVARAKPEAAFVSARHLLRWDSSKPRQPLMPPSLRSFCTRIADPSGRRRSNSRACPEGTLPRVRNASDLERPDESQLNGFRKAIRIDAALAAFFAMSMT